MGLIILAGQDDHGLKPLETNLGPKIGSPIWDPNLGVYTRPACLVYTRQACRVYTKQARLVYTRQACLV